MGAAVREVARGQPPWRPNQKGRMRKLKLRSHDSDHRVVGAIEEKVPADDARIGGEVALPELEGEDRGEGRIGSKVVGGEYAAEERGRGKDRKALGGDELTVDVDRFAQARQSECL